MTKDIICTVCPTGCTIHVEGENGNITKIEGFSCPRGKVYAENEFISPVRILTSTAKVKGAKTPLVAVRSKTPVPKGKLFDCMDEIRKLELSAPISRGDVLIANVCGTGVDIIASGEVK
ncbi:MAG: DUF1667 domain-containing protein [Clostridia bacterium]|nr:DUF1667 domain-containing protein [Clostridia bacterium]